MCFAGSETIGLGVLTLLRGEGYKHLIYVFLLSVRYQEDYSDQRRGRGGEAESFDPRHFESVGTDESGDEIEQKSWETNHQ